MILNDATIRDYCLNKNMITPFNPEQLNPASYDICVGDTLIYKTGLNTLRHLDAGSCIVFHPNELILLSSKEMFNLPHNICAQFSLKSSMARKGLFHGLAGWCDPGWHGSVLTMELINLSDKAIVLDVGEPIGQMIFMQMNEKAEKPYNGKYNNDKTVSGAKE